MIVFLVILLTLGLGSGHHLEALVSPTPALASQFPYHAVIETGGWWCNGVIVSDNFVLTRASCIVENNETVVYLGVTNNPAVKGKNKQSDSEVQIFFASQIFIHNEFGRILKNNQFINNVALIRLNKPLIRTPSVQPVAVASPEDFPIPPGTYINVTGFPSSNHKGALHYTTVQMRDTDSCKLFYGESFLEIEERCVRQKGPMRNTWAGPYVVNGVLIGLQRSLHANAKCYVSSPPCNIFDVFFSLEYFLEWIYRVADAEGEGANYFSKDNPYWEDRPYRIYKETISSIKDTVVDLQVTVQTCKANENAFVKALREAIDKGVKENIKNIALNIDLN